MYFFFHRVSLVHNPCRYATLGCDERYARVDLVPVSNLVASFFVLTLADERGHRIFLHLVYVEGSTY